MASVEVPLPEGDLLDLLDYKRRVFRIYGDVRATDDPKKAWELWRAARDELFRHHPQSALPPEARADFEGLGYFDHDPAARVLGEVVAADPVHYEVGASDGSTYGFTRFGVVRFELFGSPCELELYWVDGYGGGIFLPFRDATSGKETYGAGRYLLDTIKGADLGTQDGLLVLDFNFAYNPSCSYNPRWACPLAPPQNRLQQQVTTGERHR